MKTEGQNFVLLFLLVSIFNGLYAQNKPTLEWGHVFGGPYNDEGRSVAYDAQGNTYFAGKIQEALDFDPGPDEFILDNGSLGNLGGAAPLGYLTKLDANGNFLFALGFGVGFSYYDIKKVIVKNSQIYLFGFLDNNLDLDPGPGVFYPIDPGAYVTILDTLGNFISANRMGYAWQDNWNDFAVDDDGSYYGVGTFYGVIDFDLNGNHTLTSVKRSPTGPYYSYDIFFARYHADGTLDFVKSVGSVEDDSAEDIRIDSDGNFYVAGFFRDSINFGNNTDTLVAYRNPIDMFVVKFDTTGNALNALSIPDLNYEDIEIDSRGNILISGYNTNPVDFDPGQDTVASDYGGIFWAKYSPSGNYQHHLFLRNQYAGTAIALDNKDNVHFAGIIEYQSFTDYDPGPDTVELTRYNRGGLVIAKYDSSGNYISAGKMGLVGSAGTTAMDLVADDNDNIYVTGWFSYSQFSTSTFQFDLGVGTYNLDNVDDYREIFVAKHSYKKFIEWTGAVNTLWNEAGNWNLNRVPVSNDYVLVPLVQTNNYPVVNVAAEVAYIQLINSELTIPPDQSLTVTNIIENYGKVYVESGGSLVQTLASKLRTPSSFYVKRIIPGGESYISSPVNSFYLNSLDGINVTNVGYGQIIPDSLNPCNPDSFDISSPTGNLFELREQQTPIFNCFQSLLYVPTANTKLIVGLGYSVINPRDTITYQGTVNNGAVVRSTLGRAAGTVIHPLGFPMTRGWHMVGNPYPSPIEISGSDLIAMGFDAQIVLWDGVNQQWVQSDPLVPTTIAVGQGFLIRVTTIGSYSRFKLNNSFRVAGNPTFFKRGNRNVFIDIELNSGLETDGTTLYFEADGTPGFDPQYDVSKFKSSYYEASVFTKTADEWLRDNTLPMVSANTFDTIPLGVHTVQLGNYALTFNNINSLSFNIVLEDLVKDTLVDLSEGYVYPFEIGASNVTDRFLLHLNRQVQDMVDTTGPIDTIGIGIATLLDLDISIQPNPTTGNLQIELGQVLARAEVTVLNIQGQQLMSRNIENTSNASIDMANLPGGIYLVKVSTPQGSQVQRVVKQ